jgi:hypothetical protein
MSTPNHRTQIRGKLEGPLRLSWADASLGAVFVRGKCIDACEQGMRILVTDPVPRLCTVSIAIERMGYSGSATVRHVARAGRGYVVGLQFSQPIPAALLAKHLAQPGAQAASA